MEANETIGIFKALRFTAIAITIILLIVAAFVSWKNFLEARNLMLENKKLKLEIQQMQNGGGEDQ